MFLTNLEGLAADVGLTDNTQPFPFGVSSQIVIQAYLGHKSIQHTVRYTELSPTRFKNFWPD